MTFASAVEGVGNAIAGSGIAIIALGVIVATMWFVRSVAIRSPIADAYRGYRQALGRVILLGRAGLSSRRPSAASSSSRPSP